MFALDGFCSSCAGAEQVRGNASCWTGSWVGGLELLCSAVFSCP